MMTDLTCDYHRGIATITVHGRPDHWDLDVLRHYLDEALDRHVTLVAIDLAGVSRIDASVLGTLISAHHRTVRAGSALTLVAPSRSVRRRLEQSNLDEVFPIVDSIPTGWELPEQPGHAAGQAFAELLAFVDARATDDADGTCQICPRDAHLIDVGIMAHEWADRVRGSDPTPRQAAFTAWIASIHGSHPDYRSCWDSLRSPDNNLDIIPV